MTRPASSIVMMPIVTPAVRPADVVVISVPMTVMAQMSETVMHRTSARHPHSGDLHASNRTHGEGPPRISRMSASAALAILACLALAGTPVATVTVTGPSGLRHGQHHIGRRIHRNRRKPDQLHARQFRRPGGPLRSRRVRWLTCPSAPPPGGPAGQRPSDYIRTDADERRAYGRKPPWVQAA
jgi:hypothetical protein